jgi:putative GTP pyrophosphokinase
MEVSKTQIDRLGDRLRQGKVSEDDLRLLDQYRQTITEAYEAVVGVLRDELGLEPTGRPAKTTASISDKLRRESVRLSQVQDIAGCRVIVKNIEEQDKVVESLTKLFERTSKDDRRKRSSHGYRAVHVVVNSGGKAVEIQVRTEWQHVWAELSEKLADKVDHAIKYGGGDKAVQGPLMGLSDAVAGAEDLGLRATELGVPPGTLIGDLPDELKEGYHENAAMFEQHLGDLQKFLEGLTGGEDR